jgi:hypothetical protein
MHIIKEDVDMKKKAFIITVACVLVCAAAAGIYFGVAGSTKEPTIIYTHPKYVIDVNDPREVAGFVDFVFVGRVEKQNETMYETVSIDETEEGSKTSGLPYIGYDITVLGNIKGNLRTDEVISFWKSGGIRKDGKRIFLQADDFLPEEGDVCMFFATAWEDGTLRLLGKGGNIKLTASKLIDKLTQTMTDTQLQQAVQAELKAIAALPVYQEMVKACKNEIPYERERFTAPAELLEAATAD